MPNYQNGKIYKIYSYENADVYYGSTVESLSARIAKHRCQMKLYKEGKKNYMTSFIILELTSAKIELVENYPCNTKEELLQREGYYIKNNNCVNKVIPDRNKKEWIEDNKEYISKYQKEYREEHQEANINAMKEWYQKNKEYRKEYMKKYNQQKKEQQLIIEDTNIKI